MTDDVDPDIRTFLRETAADSARHARGTDHDLATRRAIAERVREPWVAGGPTMATHRRASCGPVARSRAGLSAMEAEALPVMVYVHGGGWMLFSIDTHDRLMREYAARTGMAVVGIDYSLRPRSAFRTRSARSWK